MMRLPPFSYFAPRSLEEAVQLLGEHGSEAAPVAGGTDLFPKMRRRQVEPKVLVGLGRLSELDGIAADGGGGLTIGARTRIREVATDPSVAESYPSVTRAAGYVASPQIRNVATLGGNLCADARCNYFDIPHMRRSAHDFCLKAGGDVCRLAPGGSRCWAISTSDLAPVAMSLDASVRLVSAHGERLAPIADLYLGDGISYLGIEQGEILAELVLPPADGVRATYLKLRRRGSIDFSLVGVAAAVRLADDGTCTAARVVLGAIASSPLRAKEAERVLVGTALSPEALEEAGEAAARRAKPMDNNDLTPSYRKRMVRVCVVRALGELAPPVG